MWGKRGLLRWQRGEGGPNLALQPLMPTVALRRPTPDRATLRSSLGAPRGVAGGIAVFLIVYLSWLAFRWLPGEQETDGDLFFLAIDGAAVYLAWRASQRCREAPRLRWFWLLMALALAGQMGGDLVTSIYDLGSNPIPFPSLADPPFLALYPFMFAALLCVPLARGTGAQRARVALDMAIVILGGTMVIWLFALEPAITEGGQSLGQTLVSIAYPIGDVVLLSGLAAVVLNWSPPAFRHSLILVGAGLLLFIVADIAYAHQVIHDEYTGGDPVDLFWMLAIALFALAAASQREAAGSAETARAKVMSEHRPSPVPFLALLVGGLSLLVAQSGNPFFPDVSLVLAALVLGMAVTVRQYLAQGETLHLQRELQGAHDQLAQLASLDSLTEIANRRAIDGILGHEVRRAQRYGRRLSVLFFDIDHFKRVNDRWGHPVGDQALKEFAAIAGAGLRPADALGRWGGEEFLAVLPETGRAEAMQTAERIRVEVERHRFSYENDARLTCSIGVSSYEDDVADPSTLLDRADAAMYAAKRSGRNRVAAAG